MENGPVKSVQPITLNGLINGKVWSFTFSPVIDTGGRGFIINPDPLKPAVQVSMAAPGITIARAAEAAREHRFTETPSTPLDAEPVRMVPLVDLPPDSAPV